jgi:hypothetical protein
VQDTAFGKPATLIDQRNNRGGSFVRGARI